MLKIEKLSKSFNNKKILDQVSLEVKKGEIALILGSSGVGKSTLLRVLNNLETYDSGSIYLNSKAINFSTDKNISGLIFQQFNLFENMSVEQNITFTLEKSAKKDINEAKKIAQKILAEFNLEDKSDLPISQLSGGQKQRLAIARSLALKPEIICFDEPTSALDPSLTNFLAQNIQELVDENYIVLIASHDTSLIEKLKCTIYLMSKGKIVEFTKSEEYLAHPDQYPLINNFIKGI